MPSDRRFSVTLPQLIESGILEPPLAIEHSFKGTRLTATITETGDVRFRGKTYRAVKVNKSPLSTVAGAALSTVKKPPKGRSTVPADGWLFWRFRSEDGELLPLDVLRGQYRARVMRGQR